jgi:putative NADH-flavin reductase
MKVAVLGGSGRTGRLVIQQALDAGHVVRTLARTPEKLGLQHPRLEVLKGDAKDPAAVARLVEGAEAVISALGPTGKEADVCSNATRNVLAAGARRYVVVSGAGVDFPGDRKDVPGKIVSFIIRTVAPAMFQDKMKEVSLLQESHVPFVLVRPPRLVEGPAKGTTRVGLEKSPGASIRRADLAGFVLRCAQDATYDRKAPFVAN